MLISLHSIYVWFHEIIAELKDFVVLVYFGFPRDLSLLLLLFYFESGSFYKAQASLTVLLI